MRVDGSQGGSDGIGGRGGGGVGPQGVGDHASCTHGRTNLRSLVAQDQRHASGCSAHQV